MSPNDKTATSVVPPPISTTIDPVGSAIGIPAPIAAAIGSAINPAFLAPALNTLSRIARFSTGVAPYGTQTIILGLDIFDLALALRMKCFIISSAATKSAITPSLIGLIASIEPGVLPSINLASSPTARTSFFPFLIV